MLKLILYGLLIWFLYNLVFRFIIPIYKTTREVKKKFSEMQGRMQDQMNQQAGYNTPPREEKPAEKVSKGDYIDFEEVK
ncbi:MAG TPA: hypothetical protein PK951_06490 [Chitinophagaceae bacterium]|nr:hypothetical protein [Chitinophagaceae bacterium]HUM64409.1 hypothetical protein [Chitinophagaceae bacterium]